MYQSLLSKVRQGIPINVGTGTFGGNGQVVWNPLIDSYLMVTGDTKCALFNQAAGTGAKTNFQTNMPAGQVPQGEYWELYGIHWFMLPKSTGVAFPEADYALFRQFILGSSYTISLNKTIVRGNVPTWFHFGHQGAQNTAVTPTLALQTPMSVDSWHEVWPEELFLPLQSNIVMKFEMAFLTAIPAGLNGYSLGVAFDRAQAAQSA